MLVVSGLNDGILAISKWLEANSRPVLIGIAGMTCSGKTTLAEKLQQSLTERSVLVTLDNFFRESIDPQLPRTSEGKKLFDVPNSYNGSEFISTVARLVAGYETQMPYYDKQSGCRLLERYQRVAAAPIIIAEGLFALTFIKDLKVKSLSVFVKADTKVCLQRRIARDVPIFRVTPERVQKNFELKVLPYCDYVTTQEQEAAIVISTNPERNSDDLRNSA